MKQKSLDGRIVVITGASSGTGRAAALAFALQGAHLVLAARRQEPLDEVVQECEELGGKAMAVLTDVTDAVAMKKLAAAAFNWGGRIDVWINNAGVLAVGPFEETPIEVHNKVVQVNLVGYINGAHAALPYFKRQQYGILMNNISVGGWFPTPYAVGYSASKFGLRGFSEALRGELYHWPQIHICDLFPAFLDSPGIQHAANYTGRTIKPAPPVYDPQRVAQAMVALAISPEPATTVGSVATFLKFAHAFFPNLSRRITASMIETYLKQAAPIEPTSGNVLHPVEYGTSIHGGWNSQADAQKRKQSSALAVGVLAISFLLLRAVIKR